MPTNNLNLRAYKVVRVEESDHVTLIESGNPLRNYPPREPETRCRTSQHKPPATPQTTMALYTESWATSPSSGLAWLCCTKPQRRGDRLGA